MTATINISMPEKLYKDAKKLVKKGKYHSISEVVRAGLRRVIYSADKITENNFPGSGSNINNRCWTPEFGCPTPEIEIKQ